MPEDENDETCVFEKMTLEEDEPKEGQPDEAGGQDPYNSMPNTDKVDG